MDLGIENERLRYSFSDFTCTIYAADVCCVMVFLSNVLCYLFYLLCLEVLRCIVRLILAYLGWWNVLVLGGFCFVNIGLIVMALVVVV